MHAFSRFYYIGDYINEWQSIHTVEATIWDTPPKNENCHHLLTFKLLQTCMSVLLLLNTKEDILKNDWNFGTIFSTMEVKGAKQLFGSNRTSKYLLLCSAEERNSYTFATT